MISVDLHPPMNIPICENPQPEPGIAIALAAHSRQQKQRWLWTIGFSLVIVSAFIYSDAFILERYHDAVRTMMVLASDAWPPDFSRWRQWSRPLAETLAMSVAGTSLGLLAALPLGAMAARTVCPLWLTTPVQLVLHASRSIPCLVWGIIYVAAVGFGPLPGVLALGSHSAGMLGKFCAELLEHVDPAPGNALRSLGVSRLGVLRFAVLPQILPRLVDVTLYRWEHNLRAATTLGIVGAGGLGLEIVTAFHLFEYREALALIAVLLLLVTLINIGGARVRAWFVTSIQR